MAENDKAPRLSLANPIFSTTHKNGNTSLHINMPKLMIGLCLTIYALHLANLAGACGTMFTCAKFTPSPDYLGCFRGHDRIYTLAMMYSSFVMGILFIGAFSRFKNVYGESNRLIVTILNISICVLLPLIAITNELNAVHWLPYEMLHNIFAKLFILLCGVWTMINYNAVTKIRDQLNRGETFCLFLLRLVMLSVVIGFILLVMERQVMYTESENWLLNENAS
jgi:hypothetical protein